MKPAAFTYHRAATLDQALALLAHHGDSAKVIAGGQSLVPMMNLRLARPEHLIDLNAITGLDAIVEDATQRVEFHLVPWDHAREELIFYLPKARLVFEGDLFASGEGEAPIAQRSADLLASTIRDRGLLVDRIVGVHGRLSGGRAVLPGRWLERLGRAHLVHHRTGAAPYGFLLPIVPARHRAAVASLRPVETRALVSNTS